MAKARKTLITFLLGLAMSFALIFGVASSLPKSAPTTTAEAETTYTTKDIAMLGRVAGWYGNGNGEIRLTLGECDWAGESGEKNFDTTLGLGDLPTLLKNLGFFDHIQLGGKTLREWGCTSCYGNIYWLNSGEPDYTLTIPIAMSADNMTAATAAGVGANSPVTILEGALIPSYAYLQGDKTATVYRAGMDYVSATSTKPYGIESVGKTDIESVKYVQGHDGTCGYFGVSLKGDDYLGDGTQLEVNSNYSYDNEFPSRVLVNGVAGSAKYYGLFNLGTKGAGYYAFQMFMPEGDMESVTIPAGTRFPTRAMTTLRAVNGNPVYIMYETQTDVTFYKQADGSWQKPMVEKETEITHAFVDGTSDCFTVLKLGTHDYPVELDNWNGGSINIKDFFTNGNFYTHVLIDDVALGSTNEAYLNVWGNKGAICFRTTAGASANKITILKGCQIPTYNALMNGEREAYVTTKDVTFVKNAQGEWVEYIPEGDFDTAVTQVQFGRSTNVLNINLSVNDYPAPDGNNAATYNLPLDAEKILALNLFDNIIVDGYTLRTRYNNYKDKINGDWLWINKFVGHNFAVRIPSVDGNDIGADKIVIRAGTQFPSMAYINNGAEMYYVTTEEVTYVRASNNVEVSWEKQAKITFKADGKTVASMPYTVSGGMDGEVPEVPEKSGYKGVWESYTLNGDDIVVNAVYTAHGFTEIETNISKMEFEAGFLILYLTNNDYPTNEGTLDTNSIVSTLHFFNYVEVDGEMVSSQPTASNGAFLNVWNRYGSFSSYIPAKHDNNSHVDATSKVVIKKGAQFPSNAYRLDANDKTCYVLTEDVTFLNENGTWVRQSNGEGGGVSIKPEYDNDYILSDLYQGGYSASTELKDGHLLINGVGTAQEKTQGNVFGYNVSQSFSLTFDFTLNIGNNDISSLGNYTSFGIALSSRGYNWSDALGWTFYLYRPENPNKCVELHCTPSTQAGAFHWWEEAGTFEKDVTYRITIGYKLIDASNGTVETYLNVNGSESKNTFVLGQPYVDFMHKIDAISFTTNAAIANAVRISDPGLGVGETPTTITLVDGNKTIVSEKVSKYTLPELNAYDFGKKDQVFVGWTTDTATLSTLYPAGYELALTADTTLYPVWIGMSMQSGAAVRKVGDSGLRFLVDIDGAAYQLGVNKNLIVGAGTLVVPTNYLSNNVTFTHETFPEGYYLDIPTETWSKQSGDVWTYAAALINISPAQYARSMSARGYLKVAYSDGTESYIYTAYSQDLHARSIYSVATAAVKDNVTLDAVLGYVNSVADITISSGLEVSKNANSEGDYTVNAAREDMTFTLTFEGNVKSVIINGTRILAGYSAEITVGGNVYTVEGFKLTSNGATLTFTLGVGDKDAYYQALIDSYKTSEAYTALHKEKVLAILEEWEGVGFDDDAKNSSYALDLERIKTQTEVEKNVGDTALATPVVTNGLGYAVTWGAVENADYYLVTDDNDYRDGVIVKTTEYKPEVVGKHNVTVTAYSYYEEYACSNVSAAFATIEVKPVYSYKAMSDGLYKFDADQMETMGLDDGTLNTKNDGTSYRYDNDAKKYFAYYNKNTGWSKDQGAATDWTSPSEFPAHAARLKAMGNNVLLISENTNASFSADDVWETSRMKYVMDTAWSLGMKVIVCDDVLYQNSSTVGSKSVAASVIASRQGFADYVKHPAFYGFSLKDEPDPDGIGANNEIEKVGYMVQALKEACANLGLSKTNGNEPFFLACLYQKNVGFSSIWNYKDYLNDWFNGTGLDYVYVDLYTSHAMGDTSDRYESTYATIYGSGTNGVLGSDKKFYQAITAHTQDKNKTGYLTEQDMYMSMLYAAAHNVAGYSWFCYFPIVEETAGSMVGFDGNGYGNGIGNGVESGKSYYDAAKTAGYQFELIQGVLDGYSLVSRSDSSDKLVTTLSNGSNTITMYVNADTMDVSKSITVSASGSVCYLIGYGVGTAEAPYKVVSNGSITLQPGQAVICVG